ncbi:hypothetical protein LX16_4267 [Stackebrandtia albiflava]|uniref:Uncharacterized protein n=1 Tax=Stackebrandtia albiflava TaxID=406432 RepID=A0A562UZ39_9ACTN|nr:hypothetical protein [Stackebrandtia albiflava]TWJ10843.1 hypothetical protein LX16_4267 [Stackebrandtia albiflava]
MTGGRGGARDGARRVWRLVRRRKLAVVVTAWAVLLAVLAFLSPSVTVREQTTVAEVLDTLDAAMGDAAVALAGGDFGYRVSGLTSTGGCDITPLRGGDRYLRETEVFAADTGAAVTSLFEALREPYRLELVSADGMPPRYTGVVPGYVELELRTEPDRVVWVADTGCRAPGDEVGSLRTGFEPPAEAAAGLTALGVESPVWRLASAYCGGAGGTVRSVTGTATVPDGAPGVDGLAEDLPESATVLVANETVLAYRIRDAVTVIDVVDGTAHASTTVDCR